MVTLVPSVEYGLAVPDAMSIADTSSGMLPVLRMS